MGIHNDNLLDFKILHYYIIVRSYKHYASSENKEVTII